MALRQIMRDRSRRNPARPCPVAQPELQQSRPRCRHLESAQARDDARHQTVRVDGQSIRPAVCGTAIGMPAPRSSATPDSDRQADHRFDERSQWVSRFRTGQQQEGRAQASVKCCSSKVGAANDAQWSRRIPSSVAGPVVVHRSRSNRPRTSGLDLTQMLPTRRTTCPASTKPVNATTSAGPRAAPGPALRVESVQTCGSSTASVLFCPER